MKLAIDCRMIGTGGIGSYLLGLLPFFIQNNDCLLFGSKKYLQEFESLPNTQIINCTVKTFSIKEIFFFPKNISKLINKCDAFYSPYCNIPSGIKIPIFSTIHDVVFLDIPDLAGKTGTFIRKCFYQHAINKSNTIFTVSNFSKERILHNLNIKESKIGVTFNALPHWFSEDVNKNIQKNKNILFVGNIKKHKGLHTLLSAYSKLLSDFPELKLTIVGNADNFRTSDSLVSEQITKLPKNSITFTGKISDSELKELYKSSLVLVQPSLYEGFGMPPLEALSLGTNVVLSDIPVFKEIYKDFPVYYFRCENDYDLYITIKSNITKFENDIKNIPDIYSFEKTYNILMSKIMENLK